MLKRFGEFLLVREEERVPLFYFLLIFLLVGTGIALGRGSANALFLKRYGIEYLPLMYLFLGVSLALSSTIYAAIADRFPPERLFTLLLLLLTVLLFGNRAIMSFSSITFAYPLYFLLFEIASEVLVMHAMLYFSNNFDTSQLKRLLPLTLAGILLGEVCGGFLLTLIASSWGMKSVMLVWGALALSALALIQWHHRRLGVSPYFRPIRRGGNEFHRAVEQLRQGIKFTRRSALLRDSSIAVFFMVIALYTLSYSVKLVYVSTFRTEEELGIVFGMITMVGGAAALLIQVFFINKWLQRYGVRKLNLVFPITTLFSFVALLLHFQLPSALAGSFNRRVLMPTLRNSSRNLLFTALPDYIQGRGRALSLVLVLPLALVFTGGMLLLFQTFASPVWLLLIGMAAGLLYLWFSVLTNRAYVSSLLGTLRETLFLPREQLNSLADCGDKLFDELAEGVRHPDEQICLSYSKILLKSFPESKATVIFDRMLGASPPVRDQLIKLISRHMSKAMRDKLLNLVDQGDSHEKATVLMIQFEFQDPLAQNRVAECLRSDNPRLAACGIFGVFSYGMDQLKSEAMAIWKMLLAHEREGHNIVGLSLLEKLPLPDFLPEVHALLQHPAERIQKAALMAAALSHSSNTDPALLLPLLRRLYSSRDHQIRSACVECYKLLPEETCIELCLQALEDPHPQVSETALRIIRRDDNSTSNTAEILAQWFARNKPSPRAQQAVLTHLSTHPLPRQFFVPVASNKIQEAYALSHALHVLSASPDGAGKNDDCHLLKIVLQERLDQAIDLALMAMENLGNPHGVRIVRAALKSRDRRHIARALEALANFEERELADKIGHLLQNIGGGKPITPQYHPGICLKTMSEVLVWCRENLDSWAQECADHVITTRSTTS